MTVFDYVTMGVLVGLLVWAVAEGRKEFQRFD